MAIFLIVTACRIHRTKSTPQPTKHNAPHGVRGPVRTTTHTHHQPPNKGSPVASCLCNKSEFSTAHTRSKNDKSCVCVCQCVYFVGWLKCKYILFILNPKRLTYRLTLSSRSNRLNKRCPVSDPTFLVCACMVVLAEMSRFAPMWVQQGILGTAFAAH